MGISLENLTCLITGCDEGMGKQLALGLHKRSANVAAGCLNASTASTSSPDILKLQMDVTNGDQIEAAVEKTIETFGRVDVLINNAGIYPRTSAEKLTYSEWRRIHEVNLDGAFRCSEAVIPHFIKQQSGNIINVGSICLRMGGPSLAHYNSSKGGLVGMTRSFARDLGQHGIRSNCIHLGAIQTEGEKRIFPDEQALLKEVNQHQSLPGRLTPDTVEPVFAFFASTDSSDITGQCITADRGWTHD